MEYWDPKEKEYNLVIQKTEQSFMLAQPQLVIYVWWDVCHKIPPDLSPATIKTISFMLKDKPGRLSEEVTPVAIIVTGHGMELQHNTMVQGYYTIPS